MAVVLVVGGAGFIGSQLVEALLGQRHTVRVLDNLSTGSLRNLRMATRRISLRARRREPAGRSHLDFIFGDVRDSSVVRKAVRGVDYVFHHAACFTNGQSLRNPMDITAVNVDGTLNVLRSARAEGVRRVVYASSWSVYGNGHTLPIREDVVLEPWSPYAASKAAGEAYCRAYWESYRLETVCLRYFNVYGPFQSHSSEIRAVVPHFILALLQGTPPAVYGDGHQTRDFIFVDDAVRATLAAAVVPGVAGRCVNVASGRMSSVQQLLQTLSTVIGRQVLPRFLPPKPGDVRQSLGDTTLARTLLGSTAQVSLAEGLSRTVAYFREILPSVGAKPPELVPDAERTHV